MKKAIYVLAAAIVMLLQAACAAPGGTTAVPTAPALNPPVISSADEESLTLELPTFATAGDPAPSVLAYIGRAGTIAESAGTVSGYLQGRIDVSALGYRFLGLDADTAYTVYVVAGNSAGASAASVSATTSGSAPLLDALTISFFDADSITLDRPTLSTAGNPAPSVFAYVGLAGTISESNGAISGSLRGPVDVSLVPATFLGLDANTAYTVWAVASNSIGYSAQSVNASTAGLAPVLHALSILTITATSVRLVQPYFDQAGYPSPTVYAYIGLDGAITVSGQTVTNYLAGPIDVSGGGCDFGGLTLGTCYRIIVVAGNSAGYSVAQDVFLTP